MVEVYDHLCELVQIEEATVPSVSMPWKNSATCEVRAQYGGLFDAMQHDVYLQPLPSPFPKGRVGRWKCGLLLHHLPSPLLHLTNYAAKVCWCSLLGDGDTQID